MKYLFINSVAGFGSTGRIAADKCRELMAQGHECRLAYGRHLVDCEDIPTIRIGNQNACHIHGALTRVFDKHGFGSKAATARFLEQVKEYDPDVIWLHNVHGYYIHVGLLFEYLRGCGKKIFWTLHDCWAFTGHCSHFSYVGCERWKTLCHDCPQKKQYPASFLLDNSRENYEAKRSLFTGIPNLTIVTPSNWLAGLVKQSFLGGYPVEVVYNTINEKIYKPTPGNFRERYLLGDTRLILGVASVWGNRKGLQDFVALAGKLDEDWKIILVGLQPCQAKRLPDNILAIPRTNDQRELAEIYTAADVFVNPSREETFGLTTVEALSCGTTAIVYRGTACEEIVNQHGGIAVEPSVDGIYRALMELFA